MVARSAATLSIQAEAPDEAMAFLYAAISPLPERYRLSYWSRCVVADTRYRTATGGLGNALDHRLDRP